MVNAFEQRYHMLLTIELITNSDMRGVRDQILESCVGKLLMGVVNCVEHVRTCLMVHVNIGPRVVPNSIIMQ